MRRLAPLLASAVAAAGCADGESADRSRKPQALPQSSIEPVKLRRFPRGPEIAFSDNRVETLQDPQWRALGIKRVRKTVPYDAVETGGPERDGLDAWFAAAKAQGVEPLVSFYRSSADMERLPSVAQFRRSFRAFRKRYPEVKLFSTWNEANFAAAQPTGRDPARTARFYRAAREECGSDCFVVAADFRADGGRESARWLREFKRGIGRGPHTWGLVSYPDVNRFDNSRTREFLRDTRGPVWVVEVGAIHFFGKGLRPSIRRQTRAMRYLTSTYPAVSPRLKRMYVYHWRAVPGQRLFDSALLSADGRPRPAFAVLASALSPKGGATPAE